MLHLVMHLADQALIIGPVQYHWMYSGEQYLYVYKLLVGNRAHPDGSVAEGYICTILKQNSTGLRGTMMELYTLIELCLSLHMLEDQ